MYISLNHNMMAANTARNLDAHYRRLAISTQRLSSGLRVNSAADDAAGLAIRELQRADIAALRQGARNANDAISMIQVADGALGIIDEKLIRMKELAEQAATGTYDSTQRLMIDSEFQAMASEIDRIANATDYNGIRLLNGSLSGAHDGSGINSKGAMKIHFGSGNDSAEDYYYVEIGDCTLAGLGLRSAKSSNATNASESVATPLPNSPISYNDATASSASLNVPAKADMRNVFQQGKWYVIPEDSLFKIPQGTKNIIINSNGHALAIPSSGAGDNDMQLFTANGLHLAGTPTDDISWKPSQPGGARFPASLPFTKDQYDDSILNFGPVNYDGDNVTLNFSSYNGMTIGYTGDSERYDSIPNNAISEDWAEYELLVIDEAKEDLFVLYNGEAAGYMKVYWDVDEDVFNQTFHSDGSRPVQADGPVLTVETQEKAQQALVSINEAMVKKDKIRASLGALQNRLENTLSNLNIQAENLQAAESRISDVDVGSEMTEFVRNQILTQSATAMLAQANNMPKMMIQLIGA